MKSKIIPFPKERIKEPKTIPESKTAGNKIIYLRKEYIPHARLPF